MQINKDTKKKTVDLSTLNYGTVFQHGHYYYMVIDPSQAIKKEWKIGDVFGIDLEYAKTVVFSPNTPVIVHYGANLNLE